MITYTATNTKTGMFYIGSAKDYCNYMNRKGNHHVGNPYGRFRKELQKDPLAFKWDYSEDDGDKRDFEASLLEIYVGNEWCYNLRKEDRFTTKTGKSANASRKDTSRSKECREKMRESALKPSAQPPHKKEAQRRAMRETSLNKSPCPNCGMMLGPGNMSKHRNGKRCPGTLYVG
jgi:hypothetical protein